MNDEMNPTPSESPAWQSNFPVRQSAEHEVSRRQFARIACGSAFAVGAGWLGKDWLFPPPAAAAPKLVCSVADIPVGGSILFRYPTEGYPCILVRPGENEFAAYSQSCTHLMCPVHFHTETRRIVCPCHEGYFSADDGRVLAGPPPRPLPRYPVELRDGQVWVKPAEPQD
jgi:nitrite reductase/ring-hydroxylating ferredoxin subunit